MSRFAKEIVTVRAYVTGVTTGLRARDIAVDALDVIEEALDEYACRFPEMTARMLLGRPICKNAEPRSIKDQIKRAESDYAFLGHAEPGHAERPAARVGQGSGPLTADTYVPANPATGDRARLVATVPQATGELPKVFGRRGNQIPLVKRPEHCMCGTEYTCKIACTCAGPDPDHAEGCHYHLWRDVPAYVDQIVVDDK
jgi:hypothetical protein